MVVHAVELLGVQLAIVGDRWQELGGTRLKKLLIVLEGVAPLRRADETLRLLLIVKLNGVVHESKVFVDELRHLL
jgi:hypothetical protein